MITSASHRWGEPGRPVKGPGRRAKGAASAHQSKGMPSSCPACGVEMEFTDRSVVLRAGTCPSCQKAFAFVEGATLSEHLGPEAEEGEATPVGVPLRVSENAPECEDCGSPLTFRSGRGGTVLADCTECETTTVYRLESGATEARETERRRPSGEGLPERGGPRGRPCRKCGAPLRFSTGEDGLLVGECESCGNRFTLPPRGGGGRGGYGGQGRSPYGSRDFRASRGGRPPFRDRGPGGSRPFRRRDRRARPRDDEDEGRRRRRREE